MNKKWLTYILILPVIAFLVVWLISPKEEKPRIEPIMNDFQAVTVNTAAKASEESYDVPSEIPASFRLVAENEQLMLYVEEETAAIIVFDKVNGEQWTSYDNIVKKSSIISSLVCQSLRMIAQHQDDGHSWIRVSRKNTSFTRVVLLPVLILLHKRFVLN